LDKEIWTAFLKATKHYHSLIDKINAGVPDIAAQIQYVVDNRNGPSYTVKTPVVYNLALDDFSPDSEIKMILVGDNPGRREQEHRRYLVGPSGKMAGNFFRAHPELDIDFGKNVLILNKTPIHTPRTAELRELCARDVQLEAAVHSSQRTMAKLLEEFWNALSAKAGKTEKLITVWIIGYSEMKKGGIFEVYTETLKNLCAVNSALKEHIFFFRHFSMNQFAIDFKQKAQPGKSAAKNLERIGIAYRKQVLG